MASFNRYDICAAYCALEMDYNTGGMLHERPSNRRRGESIGVQLDRIGFRPGLMFNGFDSLTDNGKEIYCAAVERWNLPHGDLTEFEVLDHGEDGSQYFPGCGAGIYNHVVTGVGDTAREALADALDSIAQEGLEVADLDAWKMAAFYLTDPDKSAFDSLDHLGCRLDSSGFDIEEHDWAHWVSIRYNVRVED